MCRQFQRHSKEKLHLSSGSISATLILNKYWVLHSLSLKLIITKQFLERSKGEEIQLTNCY